MMQGYRKIFEEHMFFSVLFMKLELNAHVPVGLQTPNRVI